MNGKAASLEERHRQAVSVAAVIRFPLSAAYLKDVVARLDRFLAGQKPV